MIDEIVACPPGRFLAGGGALDCSGLRVGNGAGGEPGSGLQIFEFFVPSVLVYQGIKGMTRTLGSPSG